MNGKAKQIVVVLGMHRSGTSAVTRSLKVLSLNLGDKLIGPVKGDNEKGFWEDSEINAFNESLLSKLDSAWHKLEVFDGEILLRPEYTFERKMAVNLLQKKLSEQTTFAFKDPRTAILLPFWKAVFAELGLKVGYLIVIRNPLDVADSLNKRNGFSHIKGLMLWAKYVIGAMCGTRDEQRIVVAYDSVLHSTLEQLTRISKALQLSLPENNPEGLREYTQEFLTVSLRRNVNTSDQLANDRQVPPFIRDMYAHLQKLADDKISINSKTAQQTWKRFYECYREFVPLLPRLDFFDQADNLLQEQQTTSRKEISALQLKLQEAQQKLEAQQQQAKNLAELLKQENDRLRKQQESSLQDTVKFNEKLVSAQRQHDEEQQKVRLSGELLKQENDQLRKQQETSRQEISALNDRFFAVQKQQESSQREVAMLSEKLDAAQKQYEATRQQQESSRRELATLSEKFEVAQKGYESAQQLAQNLDESLKQRNDQLLKQGRIFQDEIAVLETKLDKAQKEFDVERRRIQSLDEIRENNFNQLQAKLRAEQQSTSDLQTKLKAEQQTTSDLQTKLKAEQQSTSDLQTRLKAEQQSTSDLRAKLKAEQQSGDKLRQELEQRTLNLSSRLEKQTKASIQFQSDLAAAKQRVASLESHIHRMKASKSWRLTHPLRVVVTVLLDMRRASYRLIWWTARFFWRSIPISKNQRMVVRDFIFGRFGFLFKKRSTYIKWARRKVFGPGEKRAVSELLVARETSGQVETILEDDKYYFDLSASPIGATSIKTIAFYLPQFHCIPENDKWWGKGFTEWTNTRKAQPLFTGHHQPRTPSVLGHYDLANVESYARQVMLAKKAGVYGFCFYFYWFGGKTLLEKPLRNILANPQIDHPFCFCWANENWTRRWDGQDNEVLMAQNYSEKDAIAFLEYVNTYFKDDRYIKIDGKPVLIVYRPAIIPEIRRFQALWRQYAKDLGWPGIYLVSAQTFGQKDPGEFEFDAALQFPPHHQKHDTTLNDVTPGLVPDFKGRIYDYRNLPVTFNEGSNPDYKLFRGVALEWDNTPRRGSSATILRNFSLNGYANWLLKACRRVLADPNLADKEKLVFINAWNEWAEGTYLEPDTKYGFGYLEATKRVLSICADRKPKVSVVVPNYNHAAYIERRLNSIIHQTRKPDEIIFLDDASSDDSVKLAHEILSRSNIRFNIIKNEKNSGNVFKQWLKGIENATADLVWIAESDDDVAPEFLINILSKFTREDVLLAYGDISYIKSDGTHDNGLLRYYDGLNDLNWDSSHIVSASRAFAGAFAVKNIIPNVSGAVFRKPFLTKDEKDRLISYTFAGDWYFYALIARGGSIAFCKEAKSYFRTHQQSTSRKAFLTDRHIKEHKMVLQDLSDLYWIDPDSVKKHAEALRQVLKDLAPKNLQDDLMKNIKNKAPKNRSLRICIASYSFGVGGGEVVPVDIANSLKGLGHQITFLALKKDLPNDPPLLRPRLRNDIPVVYWDNVQDRFEEFMDDYGIEIFNSHNVGVEYVLYRKGISIDVPYMASLHGGYETVPKMLTKEFLKYVESTVDEWLYLSEKNIEPLRSLHNARFTKSFNASILRPANIDLDIHKILNIEENSVLLVLASRALHEKGWQRAIDATGRLRELTGRNCILLLIGDGKDFEAIRSANIGCKHALFLGRVDNPLPIINECDIGIFPSNYSGESFPLFIMECLQGGLPVITTDAGDIPQIMHAIGGEIPGFIVSRNKNNDAMVKEMAQAAATFILNQKRLDSAKKQARKLAQHFSIDKVTALYLNTMYKNLGSKNDISRSEHSL